MGKKTKKEKRRLREERREAERRAERRRNLITVGIVAGIVLLGGMLVWASLRDDSDPLDDFDQDELPEELRDELEQDQDGPLDDDEAPDEGGADDDETGDLPERGVACDGDEPAAAGDERPTYDEPDTVLRDVDEAMARMVTSCGEVVVALDVDRAPQAANSFAFLAQEGFFDGLEFFRIRKGLEMVQSGAGDGQGTWDVGYTLPPELEAAEAEGYPPGAVALAVPEGEPDAAGSQFFIVYGDAFMDAVASGALPREFPRFATVTDGLDVVERIGEIELGGPGGDTPLERVYIESVEIEAA